MRVLVLGGDGYLGWPTALHLSDVGHEVAVLDNFVRRQYDHEMGVQSLVPIEPLQVRLDAWEQVSGKRLPVSVRKRRKTKDSNLYCISQPTPSCLVQGRRRAPPAREFDFGNRDEHVRPAFQIARFEKRLLFLRAARTHHG